MLKIRVFAFNDFGENTYLLYDTDTLDALVVDPGMVTVPEQQLFDRFVTDNHLKIRKIVNTHLHVDHCIGADRVRSRYGVTLAADLAEKPLGDAVAQQARMFGMPLDAEPSPVVIDVPLRDGDTVTLDSNCHLRVISVPGHSPGGIVLYCAEGSFAFTGDSIFSGSIGRTDLPGGNHAQLVAALRAKVLTLPDDTQLLPGHGPGTTVAREKAANPYVR